MSGRQHTSPARAAAIDEALNAASLALRTQRAPDAERLVRDVLTSDAGNVLAAKMLGQALLMEGRPRDAIDPLHMAARGAEDAETETLLGRALSSAGRSEDAVEPLRRAITRRPAFPLAFLELGDLLGQLGRLEEGVAVFEEGLALAPDAVVLRIGLAYLHLGRNDRAAARALFAQVHAAAPQRRDAMIGLADVMRLDGDYASAAGLIRRALEQRPDDAATRIRLGRCLLEIGEREAGEQALRTAARGAPQLGWEAILALAASPHGRAFLRPSDAVRFLQDGKD